MEPIPSTSLNSSFPAILPKRKLTGTQLQEMIHTIMQSLRDLDFSRGMPGQNRFIDAKQFQPAANLIAELRNYSFSSEDKEQILQGVIKPILSKVVEHNCRDLEEFSKQLPVDSPACQPHELDHVSKSFIEIKIEWIKTKSYIQWQVLGSLFNIEGKDKERSATSDEMHAYTFLFHAIWQRVADKPINAEMPLNPKSRKRTLGF
jgi:hypothetical protein